MAQAQQGASASAVSPPSTSMDEDTALRQAMAMSMGGLSAKEDEDLQLAIKMSQSMIPGDPTESDPVMDQSGVTRFVVKKIIQGFSMELLRFVYICITFFAVKPFVCSFFFNRNGQRKRKRTEK